MMIATISVLASLNQIRGVLLEEAILMLLRASGYRTVTATEGDPTLRVGPAGLTVLGRGGAHQIDAIADLRIGQPFCNPQRLLVEAKAYSNDRKIALPIVRGAVGVLKDVSEFWISNNPGQPTSSRFHYQFALFSTSEFTDDAQRYAFSHDVHLLPLRKSSFFRPVVQAIENAVMLIPRWREDEVKISLSRLRQDLRGRLQSDTQYQPDGFPWLDHVVYETRNVGVSLIAMLGKSIPVFLTPRAGLALDGLPLTLEVQIEFEGANSKSWMIKHHGETLFTFDLPAELVIQHADNGILTQRAALDLKEKIFGEFIAIYWRENNLKVFNFVLDQDWVGQLRKNLERIYRD